jgi:hypothetical protein
MITQYFEEIVGQLPEIEQRTLTDLLLDWAQFKGWANSTEFNSCNHQKLIDNIKQERFLRELPFKSVIQDLINHYDGKDIIGCLTKIRRVIWDKYLQEGDVIQGEQPVYVATSTPKQTFYNWLFENDLDPEDADRLLEKSADEYSTFEKELILKHQKKLVWLTWDEFGEDEPFLFLQKVTRDIVCDAFALEDYYKKEDMLSFYFKLDYDLAKFLISRPTWCDAGFYDKFCSPDPGHLDWGLTKPERSYPRKIKYIANERRPEGVIRASELKFEYIKRIDLLPL